MQLVSVGQSAVSIMGLFGPFFGNKRGVRHGKALCRILSTAMEAGHIHGLVPELIPEGISHLQYADDTLIFI
jgi:hypothetical protein